MTRSSMLNYGAFADPGFMGTFTKSITIPAMTHPASITWVCP